MRLASQPAHQGFVHFGPLVLEADPLKYLSRTADRDRAVSRRSEPSSRAALTGGQPDPWDLLQPQDALSRPIHIDVRYDVYMVSQLLLIVWTISLVLETF